LLSFSLLEHSLFGESQPDICFIVRDGKSKKADLIVDETVQAFEEKLRAAGITNIKTVMPLSTLKKDFGPNNMKLKLLNTYDLFLVESEIAEHVYTILGKVNDRNLKLLSVFYLTLCIFQHFIKKRKRPLQIDTTKMETMAISIEHGTRKVSFKVSSSSNFSLFEVGTLKMETSKIVDNIASAIEQLKEKWPGGWKNVLRLYLKPMKQSKVSIPIYYSKINPNDVEVPVEVGFKQSRLDKINEQLAKRSKKLRLDKKSKKIVKVKGEAPAKKGKEQKKDKKRKADATSETAAPATEETKPKKKKKTSESEAPAPAVEEPQKKKKKKTTESEPAAIVEAPKEGKKKKEKSAATAVEPEQPATDKKADKKKKKTVEATPAVEASPEKASKKKNKKK
jgi:ribosome biogenesis protein UTP30